MQLLNTIRQEICQHIEKSRMGVFSQLRKRLLSNQAEIIYARPAQCAESAYQVAYKGLDSAAISEYNLMVREIPLRLLES